MVDAMPQTGNTLTTLGEAMHRYQPPCLCLGCNGQAVRKGPIGRVVERTKHPACLPFEECWVCCEYLG
jgi:hypothetical protein